jgi:hypothetical protein
MPVNPRLPGRPGNIRMKCNIWENQPICARYDQNEVFPLSYETLESTTGVHSQHS